jgi:transcription-repair coupling factor (superfamily II helicase)
MSESIALVVGKNYAFDKLIKKFGEFKFERTPLVVAPGDFATHD